jgi:ubiquitin thioesterase OTU1
LFSAIGVVFEGGIEAAQRLRKVVVDEIRRDPDSWSEVILGYVCSVVSPVLDES